MRKPLLLTAFAAAVGFGPLSSAQPPAPAYPQPLPTAPRPAPPIAVLRAAPAVRSAVPEPLTTKVLDVASAIQPMGTKSDRKSVEDRAERLMALIVGFVEPDSWKENGGRGSMVFFPENFTLVVNNTEDAARRVAALIEKFRAPAGPDVTVSVLRLHCAAGTVAKVLGRPKADRALELAACDRQKLLETLEADATSNRLEMPRMCLRNGQTGVVQIGGTRVAPSTAPPVTLGFDGSTYRATPTVAPDGRSIQIRMEAEFSEAAPDESTPAHRVVNRHAITGTFVIPGGCSVLVPTGRQTVVSSAEWKVPILGDVPAGLLFRGLQTEPKDCESFLLVTAETVPTAGSAPPMPVAPPIQATAVTLPPVQKPVTDWVAEYRKACAEGRTDDARRFAWEALKADPACFDPR